MANGHMKRLLTASVAGEMPLRITCDAAFRATTTATIKSGRTSASENGESGTARIAGENVKWYSYITKVWQFLQKLNTELLLYGPEISLPSRYQIKENWKLMFIQDFSHKCLQQVIITANEVGATQMPN